MRPLTLLLSALLASTALAGCAEEAAPADNADAADTPAASEGATLASQQGCVSTLDAAQTAKEPVWVLETSMGTMRVTLFCDKAPQTAQNFVKLTEEGYFDGTKFHRVIGDFMNQGGDPLTKDDAQMDAWGTGGPGYTIEDEFYCADGRISTAYPADCDALGLAHDTPGTLSMANTGRAQSGGSQFFLTAAPTPWLDGKHAVFGHTADQESLDVLLAINNVPTTGRPHDRPIEPVVLQKATIEWS